MKRYGVMLAVVLAFAWALIPNAVSGQEAPDPLIDPPEGGAGSRFQIVGQSGWTAGETVTLRVGLTSADPLSFTGPFPFEQDVTVLRDGTWSFPISVNDALLGAPLGTTPGYIVVQAASPTRTATNFYVFTVNGGRPMDADTIAPLGFGPPDASPVLVLTLALFGLGTGALVVISGATRLRLAGAAQLVERQPQLAQKSVAVRFTAQEGSHEFVTINSAAALEDVVPVGESRRSVEYAGVFESRKHVVTENPRPEIAVVAGVVAEQVPKSGLKVRTLGIREPGDRIQLLQRRRRIAIKARRMEREVHPREEELPQRHDPGAHVLGAHHRIEQLVRKRRARLMVLREAPEHIPIPHPMLQHL